MSGLPKIEGFAEETRPTLVGDGFAPRTCAAANPIAMANASFAIFRNPIFETIILRRGQETEPHITADCVRPAKPSFVVVPPDKPKAIAFQVAPPSIVLNTP